MIDTPKTISYLCSGGWIRTSDLLQVKEASYPLLYPACYRQIYISARLNKGSPPAFSVYNQKIVAYFH